MEVLREYPEDRAHNIDRPGPSEDEFYEHQDLDLAYLDSYVGDDQWAIKFETTGSIECDIDWI